MINLIAAILIALSGPSGDGVVDYMGRMEKRGFSGSVLVRRGPEVLLRAGYGFANVTTEVIPGVTLEFEGKPGLPATSVVARSCGSDMFIASRQGE